MIFLNRTDRAKAIKERRLTLVILGVLISAFVIGVYMQNRETISSETNEYKAKDFT